MADNTLCKGPTALCSSHVIHDKSPFQSLENCTQFLVKKDMRTMNHVSVCTMTSVADNTVYTNSFSGCNSNKFDHDALLQLQSLKV